jgi:hypothetical protein
VIYLTVGLRENDYLIGSQSLRWQASLLSGPDYFSKLLGYLYLGRAIPVRGPALISTIGTLEGWVNATVSPLACLGGAFVPLGHVFPCANCTDWFGFAEGFWVTKA